MGLLEKTVEAELHVPLVTARVVRFNVTEPVNTFPGTGDDIGRDAHRLDLSLEPRGGIGCYPERWGPRRSRPLGDLLFVPAGESFRTNGSGGGTSINCLLHAEPIRALFEDDFAWTEPQLDRSLDIRSHTIRELVLRLGEEARRPGFASAMLAELIAGQIAVELSRYSAAAPDDAARGGLAPWRLRLIDERLAEESAAPRLAELAELCGCSVRQLTRGFRASRGCSIGEYVARHQIARAKQLLAADESIKSIAHASGFASPSTFSKAFRHATGQTPREYRQRRHRIA